MRPGIRTRLPSYEKKISNYSPSQPYLNFPSVLYALLIQKMIFKLFVICVKSRDSIESKTTNITLFTETAMSAVSTKKSQETGLSLARRIPTGISPAWHGHYVEANQLIPILHEIIKLFVSGPQ